MDYSSLNARNQDPTLLDTHIKETMEVQTQAKVHDTMEVQHYVHHVTAIEVLTTETRSSFRSFYIPLKVKSNNLT